MEGKTNYTLLIGRKVKVIYDDGSGITIKLGVLRSVDSNLVVIENSQGKNEGISMLKFIRVEEIGGGM